MTMQVPGDTFKRDFFGREVEGWLGRANDQDKERFERVFETIRQGCRFGGRGELDREQYASPCGRATADVASLGPRVAYSTPSHHGSIAKLHLTVPS